MVSIRGLVRLGSGASLTGNLQIGSAGKAIQFSSSANTYIKEASGPKLEVYVNNALSATFESDGGILHGVWNVESQIITSDRRLKKDIQPLQRTLRDVIAPSGDLKATGEKGGAPKGGASSISASASGDGQGGDGALWLLRQLRPVSYSFRKGQDSKSMRFGFIADELDSVVPQVVRRPGDRDVADQKAVVYQDLIALLAAATQSQQQVIDTQQSKMDELETYQSDLAEMTRKLIQEVKEMKIEEERLEREERERRQKKRRVRKRVKSVKSFA